MSDMETVQNLASRATKAIWGDNQAHEEPVSGKMGNVSAGEPYDAGNIGGKVLDPERPACTLPMPDLHAAEWNPTLPHPAVFRRPCH
jgi:hypothetical protein